MMRKSLPLAGVSIALTAMLSFAPPTEAQNTEWRYCSSVSRESNTAYFSAVFPSNMGIYHIGVANSFRAYIDSRYSHHRATPNCMGLFDSVQEAEDALNTQAGRWQRDGYQVSFTRWVYRGD